MQYLCTYTYSIEINTWYNTVIRNSGRAEHAGGPGGVAMKRKKTLHDYLYENLREQIETGYYKYGEALPSMNRLCETYHVGIRTVRDVLSELRDQGMIKVSRSLKEINAKAYRVHEALFAERGREPGLEEIAEKIAVTREELVMAMEAGAQIESLQKMIYQGDGSGIVLEDKIEEPENGQESLLNKMLLEQLLGSLEAKERELIYLRFFQEKTQMQIAGELGISQVQVSRMEKKILKVLRERID